MTQSRRRESNAPSAPGIAADSVDKALEQLLVEVGRESQPEPQEIYSELRGRVAVVTGGATGIGRAITLELARQGVDIAFNYLDDGSGRIEEEAARTEQELRQLEVDVVSRSCDVRDPRDIADFLVEVGKNLGEVQILVNNAGIARDRALWRMSDKQWRDVIDTNLTGNFNMIRAVAPILRAQQFGKIVNISSIHGIRSEFGVSNFAASKAGIIGLTRSAAIELGPYNINVNAVAPGYIRTTALAETVPAEVLDMARERTVLARLGDPQDVAHVVVFLCSEMARHITGVTIPVDGGHLL